MFGGGLILLALLGTSFTMGRATVILLFAWVIAYTILAVRGRESCVPVPGLLTIYVLGLVVMGFHFCEEFRTGFQHQFPSLLGYNWRDARLLAFNASWLAVFALVAIGIYRRIPLAYLVAWFFAVGAGIGNGMGHLLLSLSQRRFFPGTFTAPLCLITGILLVRRPAAAKTQSGT